VIIPLLFFNAVKENLLLTIMLVGGSGGKRKHQNNDAKNVLVSSRKS